MACLCLHMPSLYRRYLLIQQLFGCVYRAGSCYCLSVFPPCFFAAVLTSGVLPGSNSMRRPQHLHTTICSSGMAAVFSESVRIRAVSPSLLPARSLSSFCVPLFLLSSFPLAPSMQFSPPLPGACWVARLERSWVKNILCCSSRLSHPPSTLVVSEQRWKVAEQSCLDVFPRHYWSEEPVPPLLPSLSLCFLAHLLTTASLSYSSLVSRKCTLFFFACCCAISAVVSSIFFLSRKYNVLLLWLILQLVLSYAKAFGGFMFDLTPLSVSTPRSVILSLFNWGLNLHLGTEVNERRAIHFSWHHVPVVDE